MTYSNSSNLGTKRHFVITKIRIVTRLNNFLNILVVYSNFVKTRGLWVRAPPVQLNRSSIGGASGIKQPLDFYFGTLAHKAEHSVEARCG